MTTSTVCSHSNQTSPPMLPNSIQHFDLYEKTLAKLENHIRDLANPILFEIITKKLRETASGKLDITQDIFSVSPEKLPESTLDLVKELNKHITELLQLDPTLAPLIKDHLHLLGEIKIETIPWEAVRLFFINPEPLTKKGVQEHNRQICLIYTGKKGNIPEYAAYAQKKIGNTLGTIFLKRPSKLHATPKKWIGKVGMPRRQHDRDTDSELKRTEKSMNEDTIREKLASDLYQEFGRGFFRLSKVRLSEQPFIDQFFQKDNISGWELHWFTEKQKCKSETTTTLRIMSRYVEGYHDFADGCTWDEDHQMISFFQFIKKYRRPPDYLLAPNGEQVPLLGFMEMLAVGKILADTDSFGISGKNAGFVWVREKGQIIRAETVKIDPGKAFSFDFEEDDNWVINTWENREYVSHLSDIKDFQIAYTDSHRIPLEWIRLTEKQKGIFLGVLFNSSRYFPSDDNSLHSKQALAALEYLFYRDGKFRQSDLAELPKEVAEKLQNDMRKWFSILLEIYREELNDFHQNHPEQALRAHYIDTCGELTLPMKKETFPIRDLFTELVIVDKATTNNRKVFTSIALQNLFENQQKVLLLGQPGVGKSTLCQKIAHDWGAGRLWNNLFEMVFWIPLRDLNDLPKTGNADEFVRQAISCLFKDVLTVEHLCTQIKNPHKKILLVLDGYDEANPELVKQIQKLLKEKNFYVLVTSRPEKTEGLEVDQIVENIGFSDEQIQSYINKFSKRNKKDFSEKSKGEHLFNTIKNHPTLYPIAQVPLLLQMIMSIYEKTGTIGQTTSLTKLYQVITNEYYAWYRRGKEQTEKQDIFDRLAEIALLGLKDGKQVIPHRKIRDLVDDTLLEAGILKKVEGEKVSYSFIHLTFQEYFAALYMSGKSIEKQERFVLNNRSNPSYPSFFAFLAGLIQSNPEKLQRFFKALYKKSDHLILSPTYLLGMTLRCLEECSDFKGKDLLYEALESVRLNPDDASAYVRLGDTLPSGGVVQLPDDSVMGKQDLYLKAINLNPHSAYAYNDPGNTLPSGGSIQLLDGSTMSEQALFHKAIDLNPTFSLSLGQTPNAAFVATCLEVVENLETSGSVAEAEKFYQTAFPFISSSEEFARYPQLVEKQGRQEKAAIAYVMLASLQIKEGKYKAAVSTFKTALGLTISIHVREMVSGFCHQLQPSFDSVEIWELKAELQSTQRAVFDTLLEGAKQPSLSIEDRIKLCQSVLTREVSHREARLLLAELRQQKLKIDIKSLKQQVHFHQKM